MGKAMIDENTFVLLWPGLKLTDKQIINDADAKEFLQEFRETDRMQINRLMLEMGFTPTYEDGPVADEPTVISSKKN